jgi:ethanolamine utilization microcompartment shell protein EutS
MTLNGPYNQSNGTFAAPSTLIISGNFTKSGGTFDEGTGTVIFSGGSSTVNVGISETFYNVTINQTNSGQVLTITSGQTMIIGGNLTLTRGNVNTGTFDVRGNIIQGAGFGGYGNNAIIDFGDNGVAQTYTINGGSGPRLRFDNTADANDALILNAAGVIAGLEITSGFGSTTIPITYNGYVLTIGSYGYTQAAGIFTAPASLIIQGNFTKSGGTFDEGTGTVIFSGSSSTLNVGTFETFYNVTINLANYSQVLTITSGQTMIVGGNLTLTIGNVNTGTIDVRGNIIQGAGFGGYGNNAIIDFGNNSVAQTYTLNGGTGPVLRLDDPADASDQIVLTADAMLNGFIITATFGNSSVVPLSCNSHALTVGAVVGYTQASGIFNAPDNLIFYHSSYSDSKIFTKTGGTFNAGSGTVTFSGSVYENSYHSTITETFNNVILNSISGPLTITSGETMIVAGTLTLTNGYVNVGTIDARGNINQGSGFQGGTAILDFGDNSVIQTYTLNGGTGPNLRLDNTADAADLIVLTADAGLYGLIITPAFGNSNVVPFTYNGHGLTTGAGASLTQASGIFNAPANLTFYRANYADGKVFTKTGGTFNAGSGTVTFSGSVYENIYHSTVTETFNNVILNNTSGPLTITSGETMVVAGTLTLTNGYVNAGTVDTRGNINQGSGFQGGTAILDFGDNSVIQTYTMNGGTGPNLRLNDPADAADLIVLTADAGLYGLIITPEFGNSNVVPFTYNGHGLTTGAGASLIQASGIFNAPSNLTFYRANYADGKVFTKTGGTFNAGSGTVTFSGFVYENIYHSTTTETFNNVIFTGTIPSLTITAGENMVVAGLTTFTNGYVNTGTLEARGNVIVLSTYSGGNAPLLFSGTNIQTFDLTGATGNYNGKITTNKTGGQVNLLSDLVVDAVSQDFTIQQGTFDLNGHNLTVNGTSGKLIDNNTGNLQLMGSETVIANTNYPQFDAGSTVTYDGTAGPYILKNWVCSNLTINGTGGIFNQNTLLDVNGNFTLVNGTFSPGTYNMTVAGNWLKTGGTYMPGTSRVTFDGTASGKTITTASSPFYNLTMNGIGGGWTLQDALNVSDTLIISGGTLVQGNNALSSLTIMQTGGVFTGDPSGSPANITTTGDVSLYGGIFTSTKGTLFPGGNFSQVFSTFNHNSGTVTFSGSGTQTIYTQTAVLNNIRHSGAGIMQISSSPPWVYRDKITISSTMVSNTSQTDFPLLINFSTHNGLRDHAQANFNDVVFTSYDGITRIPHEIERYNKSTGELVAWVRIPLLSSSANTVIYMYYGNPFCLDERNATAVWDTSYRGAWHLPNGTILSANESTQNGNNGTLSPTSPVATSGIADGGAHFDSATYITITNHNGLNTLPNGDWTASAWVNPSSYIMYSGIVIFNNDGLVETKNTRFGIIHSGNVVETSTPITIGSWQYLTGVKSGSSYTIYINGVNAHSTPIGDGGYNLSNVYYLGRGYNALSYRGNMDEARVSKVARSADWIKTEYNNQNNPSAYLSDVAAPVTSSILTLAGNFNNSAGTFDANNQNIILAGNWINSATFIPGTDTVIFNGANQSITGIASFYHLRKSVSAPGTLGFEEDKTTTVNGNATLTGVSGGLLSIRTVDAGGNLLNDGSQSTIDFRGTNYVNYLDVADNIASSSNSAVPLPIEPPNSVDGQNTLNWFCTRAAVSGSTGANGTYLSLTNALGAFAAINANDQSGKSVVIKLACSSSTETGTYSLNAGNWSSLTIYPVTPGINISGPGNPIIILNGADNVTIDGRVNGTGSIKNLTLGKIRFINTTVNDVMKYFTIAGDCDLAGTSAATVDGDMIVGGNFTVETGSNLTTAPTGTLTVSGNITISP